MNFVDTAASRETDPAVMEAIRIVAGSDSAAERVWADPTAEEALAIWERVTNNGLRDSSEYCWGAAGSKWAAELGLDG